MAYALGSMVQVLEQNQYYLNLDTKPQVESLLQKARSLIDIIEKFSPVLKEMETRIIDAAHRAEDIIEDLPSESELTDVANEFDSIIEDVSTKQVDPPPASIPSPFLPPPDRHPSSDNIVVGFEEDMIELRDRLTRKQLPELQILPIVGMPGSGKTTLARELYNHSSITRHFDFCAWTVISQTSNIRVSLLTLLGCLISNVEPYKENNFSELGQIIYQNLWGRRYLIVVDDLWNTKAWDTIKVFFPNDRNGSRVLLTTTEVDVAKYVNSFSDPHQISSINDQQSWKLLCRKVFGEEDCPTEFIKTGKIIAKHCRGLPLSIIIMSGLLSQSKETPKDWELVEKNVSSAITNHDPRCLEILSVSYNHLPCHLKPCFLYLAAFPENCEIQSSNVIKLWIAEGFVKQILGKTLEDTAETYLKALIDKNLLLVCRKEPNGKVKSFKIHDLLRELCRKQAVEEKFLYFHDFIEREKIMRRLSVHPLCQRLKCDIELTSLRSFLCIGRSSLHIAPMLSSSRLLRVLDVFQLEFEEFPPQILELFNLRYLAFSCHSDLPSSISKFRNLLILIIRHLSSSKSKFFHLPSELWMMTQLIHIKSKETFLCYYPENREGVIHEKLQTLSNVHLSVINNKFLRKVPNLKKLGIYCDDSVDVTNLACLHKLEKLKCSSNFSLERHDFLTNLKFPLLLKKLTLSSVIIPWGFMSTLCLLCNLEQLKLEKSDFLSKAWQPTEPYFEPTEAEWEINENHEFPNLTSLKMEELNLVRWNAESTTFPMLQQLVILRCYSMKEIPSDIGHIPALELIKVDECSPSLVKSAEQIHEEQISVYGNNSLEVFIDGVLLREQNNF